MIQNFVQSATSFYQNATVAITPYLDVAKESARPYIGQAIQACSNNPIAAAATTAILVVGAWAAFRPTQSSDLATIRGLTKEIIALDPTIGDGNAYEFVKKHGTFVDELKTKEGSLAMLAAGLRAHNKGQKYGKSGEDIVKLGNDLLRTKSGQCDHMAASVIAKIVDHIKKGGEWNTDVELLGNGGHAFVVMNRKNGLLNSPDTWNGATIIDTWLAVLEPVDPLQKQIQMKDGLVQKVWTFVEYFGARTGRIQVTHRFTVDELYRLAGRR